MALNQIFNRNTLMGGAALILLLGSSLIAGGAFGHHFNILGGGIVTEAVGLSLAALAGHQIYKQIREGRGWKAKSTPSISPTAGDNITQQTQRNDSGKHYNEWQEQASAVERFIVRHI